MLRGRTVHYPGVRAAVNRVNVLFRGRVLVASRQSSVEEFEHMFAVTVTGVTMTDSSSPATPPAAGSLSAQAGGLADVSPEAARRESRADRWSSSHAPLLRPASRVFALPAGEERQTHRPLLEGRQQSHSQRGRHDSGDPQVESARPGGPLRRCGEVFVAAIGEAVRPGAGGRFTSAYRAGDLIELRESWGAVMPQHCAERPVRPLQVASLRGPTGDLGSTHARLRQAISASPRTPCLAEVRGPRHFVRNAVLDESEDLAQVVKASACRRQQPQHREDACAGAPSALDRPQGGRADPDRPREVLLTQPPLDPGTGDAARQSLRL